MHLVTPGPPFSSLWNGDVGFPCFMMAQVPTVAKMGTETKVPRVASKTDTAVEARSRRAPATALHERGKREQLLLGCSSVFLSNTLVSSSLGPVTSTVLISRNKNTKGALRFAHKSHTSGRRKALMSRWHLRGEWIGLAT